MPTEQEDERAQEKRAYDLEWLVQPRWVKLLTYTIGIPAFLVLALKALGAPVSDSTTVSWFLAFLCVVLAQIIGGWRAKRRGQL
jgi:hypothetical protein